MNARFVLFLSVSLIFLTLYGCPTLPDQVPPPLDDGQSLLAVAAEQAFLVDDPLIRADLFLAIAAAYLDIDNTADMDVLARESLRLAELAGASEGGIRMRLRAAALLVQGNAPDEGLQAIAGATDLVIGVKMEQARGDLITEVVRAGLAAGEAGRSAVRTGLDEAYVLENPATRAETIIRIAELYQGSGVALSVTGLIQQAIPAVRSIGSAAHRALLFGRLAGLAAAAREIPLFDRLIDIVSRELKAGFEAGGEDATRTVTLIQVLITLGAAQAATLASERLPDPLDRAAALTALSRAEPTDDQALLLLDEAMALIAGADPEPRLISTLVAVGEAYVERSRPVEARRAADASWVHLGEIPALGSRVDLVTQVARLYAGLDRVVLIEEYLGQTTDPFARGSVATGVAARLASLGMNGQADKLLELALSASDETPFLPDALRLEIVGGFIETGNLTMAIGTIARMEDPVTRAQAVTRLAQGIGEESTLSVQQMSDLRAALN